MPADFAEVGREIDAEALSAIITGLQASAQRVAAEFEAEFGVGASAVIDVETELYLGTRYLDHAARALGALDLAWRFGWGVANLTPAELPARGNKVDLNSYLPLSECGLEIDSVGLGSIRAKVTKQAATVVTVATVASCISTVSGYDVKDLVEQGVGHNGSPCAISVTAESTAELHETLQKELPGLPPDCRTTIRIKLPEGKGTVVAQIPRSVLG
jgi:hypothetical protein